MTKIITITAIALAALVGVGYYGLILKSEHELRALHPEIPQDLVRKAHRSMLRDALGGAYKDIDIDNQEGLMDVIFLEKVEKFRRQ